jgi:hypothetical protein
MACRSNRERKGLVYQMKRLVFHFCVAAVPSLVWSFVAYVVASPISGEARTKIAAALTAFVGPFVVIFVPLSAYYGLGKRRRPYDGRMMNCIQKVLRLD